MPRGKNYSEEIREEARQLRRQGLSLGEISTQLGMPKNTILGWMGEVEPTLGQRTQISRRRTMANEPARLAAATANRQARLARIEAACQQAEQFLDTPQNQTDFANHIAAAMLYLGEGSKTKDAFRFANSNPQIIRYWLYLLRTSFALNETKFHLQLGIRADQDHAEIAQYWAEVTSISAPPAIYVDPRTHGKSATYAGYKGVCTILYHDVALRRYLDALAASLMRRAIG